MRFRSFENLGEAVSALAEGEIDAVVHDAPMLKYALKLEGQGRLQVLPTRIEDQYYSIRLRNDLKLRETLNRALLQVLSEDEWNFVVDEYLKP